ncbi:MAG TPA: hypothetical protein VIB38_08250 [Aestuariivirgaceae bacterium]|jgi:hypothetical protein
MNDFLRMRLEPPAALLAFALLAAPALAEESGRFVLKEADQNTFIRLDTFTGAISHCSSAAGEWNCRSVKDDRAALHEEIAGLRKENDELKERLAKRSDERGEQRLTMPSEADIDRWLALVEKYFERFLSLIRRLEQKEDGQPI